MHEERERFSQTHEAVVGPVALSGMGRDHEDVHTQRVLAVGSANILLVAPAASAGTSVSPWLPEHTHDKYVVKYAWTHWHALPRAGRKC
jgi:hypothetical protein